MRCNEDIKPHEVVNRGAVKNLSLDVFVDASKPFLRMAGQRMSKMKREKK